MVVGGREFTCLRGKENITALACNACYLGSGKHLVLSWSQQKRTEAKRPAEKGHKKHGQMAREIHPWTELFADANQ